MANDSKVWIWLEMYFFGCIHLNAAVLPVFKQSLAEQPNISLATLSIHCNILTLFYNRFNTFFKLFTHVDYRLCGLYHALSSEIHSSPFIVTTSKTLYDCSKFSWQLDILLKTSQNTDHCRLKYAVWKWNYVYTCIVRYWQIILILVENLFKFSFVCIYTKVVIFAFKMCMHICQI